MANGHGGKRPGAGRKKHYPPLKCRNVLLTEDQIKLLRRWGGGDVCRGIRWLIDTAAKMIKHRSELDHLRDDD